MSVVGPIALTLLLLAVLLGAGYAGHRFRCHVSHQPPLTNIIALALMFAIALIATAHSLQIASTLTRETAYAPGRFFFLLALGLVEWFACGYICSLIIRVIVRFFSAITARFKGFTRASQR